MLKRLLVLGVVPFTVASVNPREEGSSFAGAYTSVVYPPPGATTTFPDPNFPDASQVGFPGPTISEYPARRNPVLY